MVHVPVPAFVQILAILKPKYLFLFGRMKNNRVTPGPRLYLYCTKVLNF